MGFISQLFLRNKARKKNLYIYVCSDMACRMLPNVVIALMYLLTRCLYSCRGLSFDLITNAKPFRRKYIYIYMRLQQQL